MLKIPLTQTTLTLSLLAAAAEEDLDNYHVHSPPTMNNQMLVAAEAPSTSSSSSRAAATPLKKHDVFISFRGDDTRNNFISHLQTAFYHNKIQTFIDYKLSKGDEISPSIVKAIKESNLSVVVLSKDYASSKWCMLELTKILECKKHGGQVVIPVFYKIDPSHVRNQSGTYKKAFEKHERDNKYNKTKLHKWRAALSEVANLAGWESRNR